MRRLLVVVALSGCSFAWHDAHRHAPPTSTSECPNRARAVADTVAAASVAALAGAAYIHRNDEDSAAEIWVVPFTMIAVALASSAVYGFVEPGRCERELVEEQRRELAVAEADRARANLVRAREQAWARTRAAAEAARRGECASVRAASDDVRSLDNDFHATVFVRDVAISRCLAP